MRMLPGIILLSIAVAGCDSATTPLSPSPVPQAGPQPAPGPSQMVLSGFVLDTAFRPLAGARLEIVNGPQAGLSATADATGQFSMVAMFDDATQVRAAKDGHIAATRTIEPVCATCSPNRRWIAFYLAVPAPPVNPTGDYTLTFVADPACTSLPDEIRTRSYGATIRPAGNGRHPEDTYYLATLTGASFLANYSSFSIGVAGDLVALAFWGEPIALAEHVAPRTTLGFGGSAEVTVGPSGLANIDTAFQGVIDYCVVKSAMGQFYDCGPAQAETHVACESRNHRLILARR